MTNLLTSLLLLSSTTQAIHLASTPSAEQALVQMEMAEVQGHFCLCYKYNTVTKQDQGDPATWTHADIVDLTDPIDGNIADRGSLVYAKDGECKDRTYYVATTVNPPGGGAQFDIPFYVDEIGAKDDTTFPLPPQLANNVDPHIYGHKIVPVQNEKCLYSLWMCACWANQADGCLCAQENPGKESVTIVKPSMGTCPPGASPLETTTAAGKGYGSFAPDGAGALALKCSPNPCQACCKNQGSKCCSGCGCSGGGGGGSSGGGSCGGGVCIHQNVNADADGGGGGHCDCGGSNGDCSGSCNDCCGKGPKCSCMEFAGCENPFLQCPDAGCCCC